MSAQIFIVDRITARSGRLDAVLAAYLENYAPGAEARGMRLQNRWIGLDFVADTAYMHTLSFVWSVADVAAWWAMRLTAAFDPLVAAFWSSISPDVVARTRSFQLDMTSHV
jgi:hypothetical protein